MIDKEGKEIKMIIKFTLNSRDIILLTKICIVIAVVFPVVMCRCESWTVDKAECRIASFELGAGEDS